MRVLFFGPAQSAFVRQWISELAGDVKACWVTTEPPPAAFAAKHPAVRIVVLPRPFLRRLPRRLYLHTLDYVAEVRALVRRFSPHLIHVLYASQLDALALLGLRVPLLITALGADVLADQVPRPWPLDRLVRRLFRRATAVVAKSTFLAARCRELGARRVEHIPWGVDPACFAPGDRTAARARLGLPATERLLLSSRSLWPLYNHLALVDAAAAQPDAPRLVFTRSAQDPAHAREVAERARSRGVPATFLDALPFAAMADLYAAADACASIPSSDGLPQTVFEALSCGRPTLALDLESYADWPFGPDALQRVAHVAGRPCPDALAAGLAEVLAERERPGLLAARGWICEHARLAASVQAVRALYRELVA